MGCGSTKDKADTTKTNPVNPVAKEPEMVRAPMPRPVDTVITNITIIITWKTETIFEQSIPTSTTWDEIKSKLRLNKNVYYGIYVDNTEIQEDLSKKISEIFPNAADKIMITLKCKGLELPEDAHLAYAQKSTKIGSWILDNPDSFGIVSFEATTSLWSCQKYQLQENDVLRKFNLFSAYCNANGVIYISGGEVQQNPQNEAEAEAVEFINDFAAIDITNLNNEQINTRILPNLLEARTWHSMIFVPDNYIFIVGGTGVKSVELYDINTNTITKDSELTEARSEATLCFVNNIYWYAFCGFQFNQSFLTTVERCNLHLETRTWEKVNYTWENNIVFNPSFFGVGYWNNNIILLGENENGENSQKSYLVTPGENVDVVSEFKLDSNYISVFKEKFFMPISSELSVNIPWGSNQIEVLVLNTEWGEIKRNLMEEIQEGEFGVNQMGDIERDIKMVPQGLASNNLEGFNSGYNQG